MSDIVLASQVNVNGFNTLVEATEICELMISSKIAPKSIKDAKDLLPILMHGKEIGLKPFESINTIYNVNGKLGYAYHYIRMLTDKKGIKTKTIKDNEIVKDETGKVIDRITTIRFYVPYKWDANGRAVDYIEEDVSFTYTEAVAMDLVSKSNWQKMLGTMMWARCSVKGSRRVGVFVGYELSELLDMNNEEYLMDEEGTVTIKDANGNIIK